MRYRPNTLSPHELATISQDVTELDLSSFDLARNFTVAEIIRILDTIPLSVTALDLSKNRLGNIPPAGLVQIAKAIPITITKLYLALNRLFNISGTNIVSLIVNLRAPVEIFDLSGNDFGSKPIHNVVQILEATPVTVTTLNLTNNGLHRETSSELVQAIVTILNKCPNIRAVKGLDFIDGHELTPIYMSASSFIVTKYTHNERAAEINRCLLLNWCASIAKYIFPLPRDITNLILAYILLPTMDRRLIKNLLRCDDKTFFLSFEEYKKLDIDTNKNTKIVRYLPSEILWQSNNKTAELEDAGHSYHDTGLANEVAEQRQPHTSQPY